MVSRITFFLALISLSIFSMLNGETVELRIVSLYFHDWGSVQILYRIFIFTAIYTSFLILFGATFKTTKFFSILICSFILIDSLSYISGIKTHGAVFLLSKYYYLSITCISVLMVSLFLVIRKKQKVKQLKIKHHLLISVACIGISLIRIVYADDWVNNSSNSKSLSLSQANNLLNSSGISAKNDSLLIPFFSTSCAYCRMTANKLSVSKNLNKLPNTVIVFPENKDYAIQFLKETGLTGIPFITIDNKKFIEFAGTTWPSIFFITKKGNTHFVGGQFNSFTLSKIEK